jgi:hypothetical protein
LHRLANFTLDRKGRGDMRILLIAALMALAAWPAQAQMGGGGGGRRHQNDTRQEKKPQVDEKAYKAALERIPEPKEKYDPWSGARPAEAAKPHK